MDIEFQRRLENRARRRQNEKLRQTENHRRNEKHLQNGTKKHKRKRRRSTKFKSADTVYFDYLTLAAGVVQSLCLNTEVKRFIERHKNRMTEPGLMLTVLWPSVWDGIMRQLEVDLPREEVCINGTKWNGSAKGLVTCLDRALNNVWCRWICTFLNQAVMADVFEHLWKTAQFQMPDSVLCENNSRLRIDIRIANYNDVQIHFHKTFRVLSLKTYEQTHIVNSHLHLTMAPTPNSELYYTFHHHEP